MGETRTLTRLRREKEITARREKEREDHHQKAGVVGLKSRQARHVQEYSLLPLLVLYFSRLVFPVFLNFNLI